MKRRPTILDVAAAAGVTDGTVSRALAGDKRVRPETRNRILKAAESVGYRPNLNARGLKQGSLGALGVFCEGGAWMFFNDYYGRLLSGLATAAEKDNVRLVFYLPEVDGTDVDVNPERLRTRLRGLEALNEGRVDGGVVLGGRIGDVESLRRLGDAGMPLVLLGPDRPVPGFSQVGSGLSQRMHLAVEQLLKQGRKNLGFLGLFKGSVHNSVCLGILTELQRAGTIKFDLTSFEELDHNDISHPQRLTEHLDQLKGRGIDGLIVANSAQAQVTVDLLLQRGIRVPQDLSVITFGPRPEALRANKLPLAVITGELELGGQMSYDLFKALKSGKPLQNKDIKWTYQPLPKSTLA